MSPASAIRADTQIGIMMLSLGQQFLEALAIPTLGSLTISLALLLRCMLRFYPFLGLLISIDLLFLACCLTKRCLWV